MIRWWMGRIVVVSEARGGMVKVRSGGVKDEEEGHTCCYTSLIAWLM